LRRGLSLACAGLSVSMLSACELPEDDDSGNAPTDEIFATISVLAKGDGQTHVFYGMRDQDASGIPIKVSIGEDLEITAGGVPGNVAATSDNQYYAAFDTDAPGTRIAVKFHREKDDDAESVVDLPEGHTLTLNERMTGTEIQRGNDVYIDWQPTGATGEEIDWSVSGPCVETTTGYFRDDGSDFVRAGNIRVDPAAAGTTCDVTISLSKTISGTIDPGYAADSSITATRSDSLTITSTPSDNE